MSDLSELITAMQRTADDAAAIGEFRNADGTPNYPAIVRYFRQAIVFHGGGTYVDKDGTVRKAGTAVFPLSFCVLANMGFSPEEVNRAYELMFTGSGERARARREEFERRFPEAARHALADAVPEPDSKPSEASDALGLQPAPGILARVFRRRARRG